MFNLPAGYVFTGLDLGGNDVLDSDANPANGMTICYTLTSGQTNLTVDAGLVALACLGDFVWEDLNGNGIQDMGEPGIPNVTVRLRNCTNSTVLATTNTGPTGQYLFCDLVPGGYRIEVVLPGNYTVTVPNTPADDCKDSDVDPMTLLTHCVTLTSGQTDVCVDIGLKKPAALGDYVWEDLNYDGLQTAGEPPIAGVRVELYNCNNEFIRFTTTDGSGLYLFTDLMPSNYVVRFVLPAGYQFTLPNAGASDAIDSDAVGGNSQCVTLMSGETNRTVDAGLFRPVCLGDFVWEDLNGNGLQDVGERGVTNITLILRDCASNSILATTVTGTNGSYQVRVFASYANKDGHWVLESACHFHRRQNRQRRALAGQSGGPGRVERMWK